MPAPPRGRVERLAGRLSLSERLAGPAAGLAPILAAGRADFPELAAQLAALNPEEPYRRALTFVRERVRATRHRTPAATRSRPSCSAELRRVSAA